MSYQKKYEKIYQYILDSIDCDDLKDNATDEEKVSKFIEVFHSEYDDAYRRKIYPILSIRIANYLQGLPSICSVAYENYWIAELGKQWGYVKDDESECRFINNWFRMIALRIIEMADYYDIPFYALSNDR